MGDQADMQRLRDGDLLSWDEIDAIKKKDFMWQRPMVMWAWILRICSSSMEHRKSPPGHISQVMVQCIAAREGMAVINQYLETQLPFAYVHFVTLLVNVQNMILALQAGINFAKAVSCLRISKMLQEVFACMLISFIYQALLQITYMIEDPFGDDVLDFPI